MMERPHKFYAKDWHLHALELETYADCLYKELDNVKAGNIIREAKYVKRIAELIEAGQVILGLLKHTKHLKEHMSIMDYNLLEESIEAYKPVFGDIFECEEEA